jgi:hypothetical protein
MDGGDYSEGITKTPIVIDNVSSLISIEFYCRALEQSKLALEEKKNLHLSSIHSKLIILFIFLTLHI